MEIHDDGPRRVVVIPSQRPAVGKGSNTVGYDPCSVLRLSGKDGGALRAFGHRLTREMNGRTMAVQKLEELSMSISTRRRDTRLEVRTTREERNLIDRAVDVVGTDLTSFAVTNLLDAARQVLADRDHFALDGVAVSQWDKLNEMPARDIAGLRRLMNRPSPFSE